MHNLRTIAVLAGALAFGAGSARAEPSPDTSATVLDRLAALERRFDELEAENRALRAELATLRESPAPPVAAATPATRPPPPPVVTTGKSDRLSLGGFVHLNGEAGGAPDARWNGTRDRFLLRRARLTVNSTLKDNVTLKLEGDFGANSLAPRSSISAQFTDAYIDWAYSPALSLRGGQFKTPFGYEQLLSDTRTAMVERTLANDRLTVSRQVGLGASGRLADGLFTYSAGVFNGSGANSSGNTTDNFMWAGRLAATPLGAGRKDAPLRLSTGLNAFTTRDSGTFTGTRDGLGLDVQLAHRLAEIHLEWLRNTFDPLAGPTTRADGWSALAIVPLAPRWEATLRFETYDADASGPAPGSDTWTIGGTYRIRGDDLRFTLNYLIGDPAVSQRDEARLLGRLHVQF